MKHNELRAGNIINRHFENGEGEQTEITVRDIFDCKRAELEPDFKFSFTGIELTPEWLERFGFEKVNNSYDLDKISFAAPSLTNRFGRVYFNSWAILEQWPRHVHQLQNLFFALTGRELELKK